MAGASGHHSSHKRLLQNYIRHAGAHNKIKEESEMWRMRQRELTSDQTDYKLKSREERSYSVSVHSRRRAAPSRSDSHGNVYQRELMKMKESDPTRWGHSGYKELYPEDFESPESCGSEEEEEEEEVKEERHRARERVRTRKRSVQDQEVSSRKKRRKGTEQRKSKKAKTEQELQGKKSKRKKHLKQKRHKRTTTSPSSSQSSDHGKR